MSQLQWGLWPRFTLEHSASVQMTPPSISAYKGKLGGFGDYEQHPAS